MESGGDHDTVTLRSQGRMILDLWVSRSGGRLSHRMQSGGPRSPSLSLLSSLQLSLTPITQTIAREGNYYTEAVAVKASGCREVGGRGGAYKSVPLTSNFLTALKPSPLCLQTLFMIPLNIKNDKSSEQAYAPHVSTWGLFIYLTEKKNLLIIYLMIHKQYGVGGLYLTHIPSLKSKREMWGHAVRSTAL